MVWLIQVGGVLGSSHSDPDRVSQIDARERRRREDAKLERTVCQDKAVLIKPDHKNISQHAAAGGADKPKSRSPASMTAGHWKMERVKEEGQNGDPEKPYRSGH